jgi:regulatory helix-turn-helix LysR family protein
MRPESLDLNLLFILDALVAERNVTRAAKRVGLSQPAISSALEEARMLQIAHAYEQSTDWHKARPPMT